VQTESRLVARNVEKGVRFESRESFQPRQYPTHTSLESREGICCDSRVLSSFEFKDLRPIAGPEGVSIIPDSSPPSPKALSRDFLRELLP